MCACSCARGQGSAGSRDLYDAVVMTKKMLSHLRQDVTRSCESIIYEIEDIGQALGRGVETTMQSINFISLSSLRDTLADPQKHALEKVVPCGAKMSKSCTCVLTDSCLRRAQGAFEGGGPFTNHGCQAAPHVRERESISKRLAPHQITSQHRQASNN